MIMATNTPEPRTDPLQILGDMEGDLFDLVGACDALYVFTNGHEGPVEEISGLRWLHGEIHVHAKALQDKYYRLSRTVKPILCSRQ